MLKDFNKMSFHPDSEKLVDILCTKTQNEERQFFRVLLAYYWGLVAASMRVSIKGWTSKGAIPINVYGINLSPSGTGKGYSSTLIEGEVLNAFREQFIEHTFPSQASLHLDLLANKRAVRNGTEPQDELVKLEKEFTLLGAPPFSFDAATTPAVKQLRQKLLMAQAGAVNLQIDEIGANLVKETEVLTTFLELFDKGLVKDKLIKSTADSIRFEKLDGATPTNMLLFGTPTKLLDGGVVESAFMDFLDMGYARRCFFGYVRHTKKVRGKTAAEIHAQMFNQANDTFIESLADRIAMLGDALNMNRQVIIPKAVVLTLIEYKLKCEERGDQFSEYDSIRKAEMDHRYFKALKLAGAYAFLDGSPEITQDHVEYAIALAEESGKSLDELLKPEKPYTKLATYLATSKRAHTLADLDEDLPFFKGSRTQRDEMIAYAISWGYKNNVIIQKNFDDGVLYLTGETLEETNTEELILSYSDDMTRGYQNVKAPFEQLHNLTQLQNHHWLNHHLAYGDTQDDTGEWCGYRKEDNVLPGFNMLVLDIDGTCTLSMAKALLKDYRALYYTTKSHSEDCNRFRIILPTNYVLKLDSKEFKEFFSNLLESLPFDIDESGNHRSKKWLTNDGHYEYTDGELFDVMPFIPRTSKNEERRALVQDQQQLDNLERWIITNTGNGNRNVQLHKYARILVDAGFDFEDIRRKVLALNEKLPNKLDENELTSSIFATVTKALGK